MTLTQFFLYLSPIVCTQDWLEIYNVFKTGNVRLIGRYCATSAPGQKNCCIVLIWTALWDVRSSYINEG